MNIRASRIVTTVFSGLCLTLLGCSETSKMVDGHVVKPKQTQEMFETSKYDSALTHAALEYLELTENYTPDTFETQQKEAIAMMTSTNRQAALDYLPKRVTQVLTDDYSNHFTPARETAVLGKVPFGDLLRAQVKVEGVSSGEVRGKDFSKRVQFTVNMLVYNIDDIEFESVGVKGVY